MVIIMVIIMGKVVAGDLVAIQYEGRLEGEDGEIFHATELRQPFVFVVRRILTNLVHSCVDKTKLGLSRRCSPRASCRYV